MKGRIRFHKETVLKKSIVY